MKDILITIAISLLAILSYMFKGLAILILSAAITLIVKEVWYW